MSAPRAFAWSGGFGRTRAMLIKEFIQLRRDRVSFGMIILVPLMQLLLFGYAINTTPRDCRPPCCCRKSPMSAARSSRRFENTKYFKVTRHVRDEAEFDRCWPPAKCCSRSRFRRILSAPCAAARSPAILVAADATDPVASGSALAALAQLVQTALAHDRGIAGQRNAAVRGAHPCAIQSVRGDATQYRTGPGRHHPHHDDADFYRAVGDAGDRARHHGDRFRCRSRRSKS